MAALVQTQSQLTSLKGKNTLGSVKTAILGAMILIGVFGNAMNMIVFARKSMRKINTFRFLLYLSAIDILVLLTGTTDILMRNIFRFEIRYQSSLVCKFHTFLTYSVTQISSVLLMVMSIHRAMDVVGLNVYIKRKTSMHADSETSLTRGLRSSEYTFSNVTNKIELSTASNKSKITNSNSVQQNLINTNFFSAVTRKNFRMSFFSKETRAKSNNKFVQLISDYFTVDIQILTIFTLISLLNSHFLVYLDIRHIDHVSVMKQQNMSQAVQSVALLFGEILNEQNQSASKLCFAQEGSNYKFFLMRIWFWIDLTVYSLVPFVAMFLCFFIILVKFRKINKNYTSILSAPCNKHNMRNFLDKIRKNRQICLILLNSCFYFLLTMMQYWICFFLFRSDLTHSSEVKSFAYIFLYTNNAFNFIIYGFSSEKYRTVLVSMFKF